MHKIAGVVEILFQNPQNALFCAQNTNPSPEIKNFRDDETFGLSGAEYDTTK